MDYKLRRYCILGSLLAIGLVSLVVLFMNHEQKRPLPQESVEEDFVQEEIIVNKDSNQLGNDLKGFLEDQYFFDVEPNPYLEALKTRKYALSLRATSVEKDLRIYIVGYDGEPVVGQNFTIEIEDLGQYEDGDMDGYIHVTDLEEGDYYVSILPHGEYRMPENATKIHVKDWVEYLAIDDIAYQILDASDVVLEAEDIQENPALSDGDKNQETRLQATTSKQIAGVDVNEHNGEIDWDKVVDEGVGFAIIRVGYRGADTEALVLDSLFEKNMRAASMAGIETGVYFASRATNEVEAVEEASMVLSRVKDYMLDYPIYFATSALEEDARVKEMSVEERTKICEAFCRTIVNAGYEVGIMGSRGFFNSSVDTPSLEDYNIWLAEYRKMPLYKGYYEMWQHTSRGKLDGMDTEVNLNISYLVE